MSNEQIDCIIPPKIAQLQTMGAIGTLNICGLTTWTGKEALQELHIIVILNRRPVNA